MSEGEKREAVESGPEERSHVIDMNALMQENMNLKSRIATLSEELEASKETSMTEQLWLWIKDCKMRRTAYWRQYYRYQLYNNFISSPLTLIASATGVTSIAQLGYETQAMQIAVAVLGTVSTALTAYQRYYNWGQKAIHCREVAKRYTLLARRGEMQANLYSTNRITVDVLVEFMENFRKELDAIQMETEDMPNELLDKKFTADPNMTEEELRQAAMLDADAPSAVRKAVRKFVNRREVMFSKTFNGK